MVQRADDEKRAGNQRCVEHGVSGRLRFRAFVAKTSPVGASHICPQRRPIPTPETTSSITGNGFRRESPYWRLSPPLRHTASTCCGKRSEPRDCSCHETSFASWRPVGNIQILWQFGCRAWCQPTFLWGKSPRDGRECGKTLHAVKYCVQQMQAIAKRLTRACAGGRAAEGTCRVARHLPNSAPKGPPVSFRAATR